jgi:hypothetical protein
LFPHWLPHCLSHFLGDRGHDEGGDDGCELHDDGDRLVIGLERVGGGLVWLECGFCWSVDGCRSGRSVNECKPGRGVNECRCGRNANECRGVKIKYVWSEETEKNSECFWTSFGSGLPQLCTRIQIHPTNSSFQVKRIQCLGFHSIPRQTRAE